MTTPTDKVRAALERACIWDVEGAEYYRDALREMEGMVLVPVEPTGTQMIAGGKKHQPNKHGEHETLHSLLARETYKAMIAPYVKGGDGDAEV